MFHLNFAVKYGNIYLHVMIAFNSLPTDSIHPISVRFPNKRGARLNLLMAVTRIACRRNNLLPPAQSYPMSLMFLMAISRIACRWKVWKSGGARTIWQGHTKEQVLFPYIFFKCLLTNLVVYLIQANLDLRNSNFIFLNREFKIY